LLLLTGHETDEKLSMDEAATQLDYFHYRSQRNPTESVKLLYPNYQELKRQED
jgi:hypothetical protein